MVELPDLCPGITAVDTTCLSAKGTGFQNHPELKVTIQALGLRFIKPADEKRFMQEKCS